MLLKNAFIALFSFSILHADMLKECKSEEDKIQGCVETSKFRHYGTRETPYKNGKKDGIVKWYKQNGNLAQEVPYKDGKLEGVAKWYYESGNLRSETSYKNDKREGIEKSYDENGNLRIERSYLNDLFHGDMKYYIEDGKLLALLKAENHEIISGKCSNNKALTIKEIRQIDIFDTKKTINYLKEICLKSDSK